MKVLYYRKFCQTLLMPLLLVLGISFQSWAQIKITGTVTAGDGTGALPGVNIALKGTTTGTITDAEGKYAIEVPSSETVLIFSYIGHITEQITVGDKTVIDLVLTPDITTLGEIVIVGYGEQSRKTLTTSISKVDGETINRLPVSTPGEALAAMAAGVQVQSGRGGSPGDPPAIRIRGVGSLGASSEPLYVVDGYPLQDAGNFNLINASDIESIEVLKDAASAAIYGSRAANGVVIVTTKRGKSGATKFDLNFYTGVQEVAKTLEVMNRDEYLKAAKDFRRILGQPALSILDSPDLPDTDWQDEIFRTAPMSEFQLSASGGSEKTRYLISGTYFSQDGTLLGTSFNRYNVRLNMDTEISKKLKLGVSLAPSYSEQDRRTTGGQFNSTGDGLLGNPGYGRRATGNPLYTALVMAPIVPVRLADGDYGQPNQDPDFAGLEQTLLNPVAALELPTSKTKSYRILGNGYLTWQLIKGLEATTRVGATLQTANRNTWIPSFLATTQNALASRNNPLLANIYSTERLEQSIDWLWENTLRYTKSIGEHNVEALLLYSLQKYDLKRQDIAGTEGTYSGAFITRATGNPTAASLLQGTLEYGANAFVSYGARVTYDYKKKYLLTAAVRRDGSSRFGTNNRFGTFPSVSVGWRVSEEPFFDGAKRVVSELKLRSSYGETGNASIGDFTWLSGIVNSNYAFGSPQTRALGTRHGVLNPNDPGGYLNPDLTWEKSRQTNIGLEAGFLEGKVNLTVDYYEKITKGMLFDINLAGIVGYARTYKGNLGELSNKGIEISLGTNVNLGPVSWKFEGNFSRNENLVLELDGNDELPYQNAIFGWTNVYRIKKGAPIGDIYGYVVDGVFKTTQELAESVQWTTSGNLVGDWKIRNTFEDGVIDERDMTKIGNALPDFTYGMSHRFAFKNFDLSIIGQGVYGNDIVNGSLRHTTTMGGSFNVVRRLVDNYYDPDVPDREVLYHRPGARGVTSVNAMTTVSLGDGSFFRIRNITLGYNLPKSLLQKVKVRSFRAYISAQNLFTFTNYLGSNPEVDQDGNANRPGLDQGTYPAVKLYTLGFNLGF
jgi:TonB-linked SusC/RagA family outer membrane protein